MLRTGQQCVDILSLKEIFYLKDQSTGEDFKIEIFLARLYFGSKIEIGYVFSPPCAENENCITKMAKVKPVAPISGEYQDCTDWPRPINAFGPHLALQGSPMSYSFRMTCRLGKRFKYENVEGQYLAFDGSDSFSGAPPVFKNDMPDDEGNIRYNYRTIFEVPLDVKPADYRFSGCVNVYDSLYHDRRCIDLKNLEVEIVKRIF